MTEEYYQDGIKLPTDNDISTWKEKVGANVTFARSKIDGGYLYYLLEGNGVCFVPDNPNSLREFEQEKVIPWAVKIQDIYMCLSKDSQSIQKLEERADLANECFAKLDNKFEERMAKIEEYLSQETKKNFMQFQKLTEKFNERIHALEITEFPSVHSLREFEKEKVEPLTQAIGYINNSISNININIKDHIQRMQKLEEHHTRQIDENRKVSKILNDTDELLEEFKHPRDEVKLCSHGNVLPNCTACY